MKEVTLENRLDVRNYPTDTSIMKQNWRDLLFLHWKYDVQELQEKLPPGLYVDTFHGDAYITMSPFSIENLRLPNLPALPGLSNFIEVNVRTYVYDEKGIPGVWFFSLDLNSAMAAKMARTTFFLPYFFAELTKTKTEHGVVIEGKRDNASIKFNYGLPKEAPHEADPETLEFFLIERYALYSFAANQLNRGRVHHQPYPISKGSVSEWSKDLLRINSLDISRDPDEIHYSSGVDVDIFKLVACH